MKFKIQKIVDKYNEGELSSSKMQNEIMKLSIVKKNDIKVCRICEKHILMLDGTCPKCTISLSTSLEASDL
jgi:hypothetical protein